MCGCVFVYYVKSLGSNSGSKRRPEMLIYKNVYCLISVCSLQSAFIYHKFILESVLFMPNIDKKC